MIFLICTPAIGLVFWFVMARCIPYYKQLQAKLDRIALICREGLSGARVVRAFVREGHERERFAQAADDQANTAIAVGKLSSILNPVTFLGDEPGRVRHPVGGRYPGQRGRSSRRARSWRSSTT